MTNLFVLLEDRAIEVLHEITKPQRSRHPVARAIVDRQIGQASILTTRPQDEREERILRIETEDAYEAFRDLVYTAKVVNYSTDPTKLHL